MRFLRFLTREFIVRGVVFAVAGTMALTCLYLLSIGAPPSSYAETGRSFLLLVSGSKDFSADHPGFTAGRIIASGAAITFPLALASLVILTLTALSLSAFATTARYLETGHGSRAQEGFEKFTSFLGSA